MTIEEKDFHILDGINEVKWITGTDHKVTISSDFNGYAQLKRWSLANCTEPVAFVEYTVGGGEVYFYDEEDAMAFKLRWVE